MSEVLLGDTAIHAGDDAVTGGIIERAGEAFYRIGHYDRMPPFFIAVVSGFNHWMYVSSTGGLTCGRRHPGLALFPYETDDRIHDACNTAGPLTAMRVSRNDTTCLWQPFSQGPSVYRTERNLYKSLVGNRLVFEEINHSLEMAYEYEWATGDRYGFIRKAVLRNTGQSSAQLELMDGLRNLLPYGADQGMQANFSTLLNAYRQAEVHAASSAALYTLSSIPTDRAEPSESLKATIAWSLGLDSPDVLLSCDQLDHFRRGGTLQAEHTRNGRRCDYMVHGRLNLEAGQTRDWYLLADVAKGPSQTVGLLQEVESGVSPDAIEQDIEEGARRIRQLAGRADAFQFSSDELTAARHFSNTLFNIMRGGVFQDGRHIQVDDFKQFLSGWNSSKAGAFNALSAASEPVLTREALVEACEGSGDADLLRLAHEYLPLTFSRRHGDPSRPWNHFDIDLRNPDGSDKLWFQGNWRDIFQNWEALSHSFPEWISHFISKFVNASTADGYNPYRITRDGIDWEVHDPGDPWSNIGYWGDHQVIYLLKLLEGWHAHAPDELTARLGDAIYSYADVPYRIKPYAEILRDPSATIGFDHARAARIETQVAERGTDGKLVTGRDGAVHHANLLEKLLVPALAKLSNLIPDAGIWMNTQRPEWNDANNALAGGGVSVVTLAYLRRYLAFLADRLAEVPTDAYPVATEVVGWFTGVEAALQRGREMLQGTSLDPIDRRRLLDALGGAFGDYRASVYASGFGENRSLSVGRVRTFLSTAIAYVDWGLEANRRPDGLIHTYNVANVTAGGVEIGHLPVMLEGQVALLSAGVLSPAASLELLEQLFASELYRPEQRSFMLYPERSLPGFLERNVVPAATAEAIPLLRELGNRGDRSLVARDADGTHRFNGDLRHADDVAATLDRLARRPGLSGPVARDRQWVLDLFEEVFNHRSYTGRSGRMYGYEGLGCIYWHMVAKLLLAVQEICVRADDTDTPLAVRDGLADMYRRVRAGIGYEKSVAEYGAFPTDPYSHTPPAGGAKQPGMTGQVKEEILTRRGELGIHVQDGRLRFAPRLLDADEFLAEDGCFQYRDIAGSQHEMTVPRGSLVFTLCQVPVVYERDESAPRIQLDYADGTTAEFSGDSLTEAISQDIFGRTGHVTRLRVGISGDVLRAE